MRAPRLPPPGLLRRKGHTALGTHQRFLQKFALTGLRAVSVTGVLRQIQRVQRQLQRSGTMFTTTSTFVTMSDTGVCRFQLSLLSRNGVAIGVFRDLTNGLVEISLPPKRDKT